MRTEKESLTPFATSFPPRLPLSPLLSEGRAGFQRARLHPTHRTSLLRGKLYPQKYQRKRSEHRTKPTLCPRQGPIQLCSKDNAVGLFLLPVFSFEVCTQKTAPLVSEHVLIHRFKSRPLTGNPAETNRVCLPPAPPPPRSGTHRSRSSPGEPRGRAQPAPRGPAAGAALSPREGAAPAEGKPPGSHTHPFQASLTGLSCPSSKPPG